MVIFHDWEKALLEPYYSKKKWTTKRQNKKLFLRKRTLYECIPNCFEAPVLLRSLDIGK